MESQKLRKWTKKLPTRIYCDLISVSILSGTNNLPNNRCA